ncbi:protein GAMETE EXPRESSED 1 [Momordica charantia]|uniref:Protein GAMETE EXPRESSED 1 n=1 Tax=Momordica charantia TaxID=3673 RepID=A0A6J1CNX6_MOMCH|nr:protein GAMETE EXPRESSED 1 [Momordica charantia]XP_022143300.1 protein GAMETE EXPRESSED 1 [Momordica charantia]
MERFLFLVILLLASGKCESWIWFSSSSSSDSAMGSFKRIEGGTVAEFSMEGFDDQKGVRRIENAKNKLTASNSCWESAYRHLFAGCSEIFAADEKRSRFAWHLSDCFQKDSGRPPFPSCDPKSAMSKCLKYLNEHEHRIYLEFYLETNSICHQLQAHAFKHDTERLVNELKRSSEAVEGKLETIEEKSESLLQNSYQIFDSLNSTGVQIQQMVQTSRKLEDHMGVVLKHSEAVYEQTKKIETSQSELQEGQLRLRRSLEEGMEMLQDSYSNLSREMDGLRDEAMEIEKEITKVGDAMFSKMKYLQSTADDIGNMAGLSLDKQQELLDAQSTALNGLHSLSKVQSEALEESRSKLQDLAEYGHRQQEELLQRQGQLQQLHDRLMENSKTILEAQQSFESKQANMFIALEKLFTLHNAMLLESRLIKVFFIYFTSVFIIYMFSSTKQTYTVRPWLYIELCASFLIEVAILRVEVFDTEQRTWIVSVVRTAFLLAASLQLLHAIFTYRDYDVLNHHMLLMLMEKINGMETPNKLCWESDSEVNWSSWIDTELSEDNVEDPDFVLPEEVGENSITTAFTTRRYNLRRRPLRY